MSEVIDSADRTEPASFVPPQPEELAQLLPSYDVTMLLALGGMGAVYSGMQRDLERPVAIKVLPPDAVRDTESIDRFRTEAKAMARLTHPHIPAVFDFAVVEGFGVLIMELIDGPNVYALIKQTALPPPRALQLLTEVCDAVQFAHSRGVIHGDIKPGNIMLDADGRVKLADFGLARLMVHGDRNAESWTPMGTPEYAAPELYDRNAAPDHRADIYSLGVVLHEMLTGAPPVGEFDLPGAAMGLDPRVDEIIARCMELQPEDRYQSAAEVRTVLQDIIDGRNVPVPEPAKTATRKLIRPGRKAPPGARRKASQQKLAPATQQKLAPGPATVARGSGPPTTIAPMAKRRRKVVVVEGGRPPSRGGGGGDMTRNILLALAIIVVLAAAYFILTRGGNDKTPEKENRKSAETTPAVPVAEPTPAPTPPEPVATTNNPSRSEPRPEPKVEPKVEPKPAEPPPSKVYAKLHEMKIAWREEWNNKVDSKITTEMAALSKQYTDLLQKLDDEMMAGGEAAKVLAVRDEQKRFAKEKTPPKPEQVSTTLPALTTYQKAFIARTEKAQTAIKYDVETLREKYMGALQQLERSMDNNDDKAGSKIAAAEFDKVKVLTTAAELRAYFNAPEEK